jgi:hypothetical protein
LGSIIRFGVGVLGVRGDVDALTDEDRRAVERELRRRDITLQINALGHVSFS